MPNSLTADSAATPANATDQPQSASPAITKLTILIDGDCPLCAKEGALLKKMDKGRGRLDMVDIAADDFDPAPYGATMEQVTGAIHAYDQDGNLVTGMAVFRHAYRLVGWGWLMAPTGWPLLKPIADAFYRWFARNRYRITLRKDPCAAGRCKIPGT